MVEVVIDSIRVSLVSQQQVVLLREKGTERYLPIWIGAFEANAIQLALHEVELARPMTHDLMRDILETLGARVEHVEVTALKENTFYGNIVLSHQGRIYNIDARPSDAIALAVRAHVPIYVAREVMDEAAIVPDEDVQETQEVPPTTPPSSSQTPSEPSGEPTAPQPPQEEIAEDADDMNERLSVFADFLEKLDFDAPPTQSEDDEGDDKPPSGQEQ
ncbi:MAG: bifunctional nuclease family protein [Chloroflexi bacterium]|nr:bifunctional nuclease family protein [Chloroflexota bacterium]